VQSRGQAILISHPTPCMTPSNRMAFGYFGKNLLFIL
jgi:hypothetical protein